MINLENLRVDCQKCFGLCCIALYFSASEGFPTDKEAGKPCINLQPDFSCRVHRDLRQKGLKGCTAYDCFGAGQKVAQHTYRGCDWRQAPETTKQMFEVFLIMRQLHEMMWYLSEALKLEPAHSIRDQLNSLLNVTEDLTNLKPDSLQEVNLDAHRANVNKLLLQTSELVRAKFGKVQKAASRHDYFGADLRKADLRGADLRGACLIAANLRGVDLSGADLIGADMRDTDLRRANLSQSIFVTQAQLNTSKGDAHTRLPEFLVHPVFIQ